MFDELQKYKDHGHFFFKLGDNLKEVCNAPTNKSGIYIVYALEKGQVNLIYIGRSGKLEKSGTMFVRKAGVRWNERPTCEWSSIWQNSKKNLMG